MKILSTAWNIFEKNENTYDVNRNGGAIMISDICEYIGRIEESYLFTGSTRIPEMQYGHIHVLDNRKYLPEERMSVNIGEWHEGLKRRFREILNELKPDFVLVQGGIDFSTCCIDICREQNQKYALVDHLYVGNQLSFQDDVTTKWEKRIFSYRDINVIAVSTAMRKRILDDYPTLDSNQVYAIPNGTPFVRKNNVVRDFRKELTLDNKKVLLCSGALHPRKNQMQLVSAVSKLPKNVRDNIVVLFCGKDSVKKPQRDLLESAIKEVDLENHLRYIGTFSRVEMHDLYASIDGLIMPSLNEGLSLVAIEALVYGKPVIMFADNETAGDVNDRAAVVLVDDHSDEALAQGIVEWYKNSWDMNAIIKYSGYFNMERVANEYVGYMRQHAEQRSSSHV